MAAVTLLIFVLKNSMKRSYADTLIQEINELKNDFQGLFDDQKELKWLQGVERCMELKMKVWGFDGKQPVPEVEPAPAPKIVLDLTKLSTETLSEIVALYQADQTNKNV